MSTNSVVGYFNTEGEFRGTYVHWDGLTISLPAGRFLKEHGYAKTVEYIEVGIAALGYSSFGDAEPTPKSTDLEGDNLITIANYFESYGLEFAWVVMEDGRVIRLETAIYERTRLQILFDAYWVSIIEQIENLKFPNHDALNRHMIELAIDGLANSFENHDRMTLAFMERRVGELAKGLGV